MEQFKELVRPFYLRNIYFRLLPERKPEAFDLCWNYPAVAPADIPPGQTIPDVLFLPMTDWHNRIQRTQFIAKGLAQAGHRCFLLNPHLGREFPDRSGEPVRVCELARNIYEVHVRLSREPVFHHRMLLRDEVVRVASALRSIMARPFLSMVSFPVWHPIAQQLEAPVLYDCHDLLSGFGNIHPSIVAHEAEAIRTATLTIASGIGILQHCRSLAGEDARCLFLRNAVESVGTRALEKRPGARKTIGYVGALEDWFDVNAIETAARVRPEWDFAIAGRADFERDSVKMKTLLQHPNIRFAGEIQRTEVPAFLGKLDVGLIPFVLNPLTLAADPIKLYEYLAAGLPVVSSRLPETERMAELIHYYDSPQDIVLRIEQALSDGRVDERRSAVRQETWAERVNELRSLFPALMAAQVSACPK